MTSLKPPNPASSSPALAPKPAAFASESAYQHAVDSLIAQLEDQLERAFQNDAPFDYESQSGILTIDCNEGGKIIINRQAPLQELWVAARSGGFHFRKADDGWRDTRSNILLEELLGSVLAEQSGMTLEFSL